jgi:hypothetical protein
VRIYALVYKLFWGEWVHTHSIFLILQVFLYSWGSRCWADLYSPVDIVGSDKMYCFTGRLEEIIWFYLAGCYVSPRQSLVFVSVSFIEDAFSTHNSTTEFAVFRPRVTQTPTLLYRSAEPIHTKHSILTFTRSVFISSRYIFRRVTLTIIRQRQNTSTKWKMLHRRPFYSRSFDTC